jgi:hypothetical protein
MWGWLLDLPPYIGAPGGIRTHNRLIRSQMLYPLSYGGNTHNAYYTLSFAIEKPKMKFNHRYYQQELTGYAKPFNILVYISCHVQIINFWE